MAAWTAAIEKIGSWIGDNQSTMGAVGTLAGIGTKIGSAVQQARANRLAMQAANQQNATARENLAEAANPMNNPATQAAINAGEQQIEEQQRQADKQGAVMGATPEMQLAQRQQGLRTLADMYATVANGAYDNYLGAKQNADSAAIAPLLVRQQQMQQSAQQLNTAADNLLKAGKTTFGGVK